MKTLIATIILLLGVSRAAAADAAVPATRPATQPSARRSPATVDEMLHQLLAPSRPMVRPLDPLPDPPAQNSATGAASVAPNARPQNLLREGTMIWDRKGRLARTPDGQHEFVFESDGRALQDPPMIILPNLALMAMENAARNTGRELRFSITGMVTEYGTRNYILLEKVVVVPD